MDRMSDPSLPHGELPPIPDGCGILPIAENRIARGPHPELLDAVSEGFHRWHPRRRRDCGAERRDGTDLSPGSGAGAGAGGLRPAADLGGGGIARP